MQRKELNLKSTIQLKVSELKTIKRDDFGTQQTIWQPTKIKEYQTAKVPGIWVMKTFIESPSINLKDVQVGSTMLISSIGKVELESNETLTGKLGKIEFRNQSSKVRAHKNMLSTEVSEHDYRDLPSKSAPKPHRVLFSMGGDIEVEAL